MLRLLQGKIGPSSTDLALKGINVQVKQLVLVKDWELLQEIPEEVGWMISEPTAAGACFAVYDVVKFAEYCDVK